MNFFKKLNTKRKLKKLNPRDIPKFSFDGVKKYARIYKVYDGDTCTLLFNWKKQPINITCRILGIDTPEIRTKNELEKKAAYEARDYLIRLIHDKILYVHFYKNDKYGRPLIEIFLDNRDSISDIMIKKGYAISYFGGSKQPFK